MLAIDEINQDDSLLPNISLGYVIVDSCSSPTNVLRAALTLMSMSEQKLSQCHPPPVLALIAESGSTQSLVVAGVVGPFKIPLVMQNNYNIYKYIYIFNAKMKKLCSVDNCNFFVFE